MKTVVINITTEYEKALEEASRLLQNGEVVGIPTETVYGLAANALDADAVRKIFLAKGRPSDNPLIVHIAKFEDLEPLVDEIPEKVKIMAEKFCLTRFPSNSVTQRTIFAICSNQKRGSRICNI